MQRDRSTPWCDGVELTSNPSASQFTRIICCCEGEDHTTYSVILHPLVKEREPTDKTRETDIQTENITSRKSESLELQEGKKKRETDTDSERETERKSEGQKENERERDEAFLGAQPTTGHPSRSLSSLSLYMPPHILKHRYTSLSQHRHKDTSRINCHEKLTHLHAHLKIEYVFVLWVWRAKSRNTGTMKRKIYIWGVKGGPLKQKGRTYSIQFEALRLQYVSL